MAVWEVGPPRSIELNGLPSWSTQNVCCTPCKEICLHVPTTLAVCLRRVGRPHDYKKPAICRRGIVRTTHIRLPDSTDVPGGAGPPQNEEVARQLPLQDQLESQRGEGRIVGSPELSQSRRLGIQESITQS